MTKRAAAYIDGFNFYNGCMRDEPGLKWLDLRKLCESLVRGCHFEAVRYYTAKVFDIAGRTGQRRRQEIYLRRRTDHVAKPVGGGWRDLIFRQM